LELAGLDFLRARDFRLTPQANSHAGQIARGALPIAALPADGKTTTLTVYESL
jgi:hypothetical protein